jgi:murein DD-endopeptidase MepM/ murein hydrolase activator NlpD
MQNEFLKAKLGAISKKVDELLIELSDSRFRTEDDAEPRTYLPPFMDFEKATIIWQNFGVKRRLKRNNLYYAHCGQDITAPGGAELWAPARSMVTRVRRSNRGWGNLITLKITEGYWQGLYITYCHCQDIANLKKGDIVEPCEVVAWVGRTGNSTGPHVHVMCSWLVPAFTGYHARIEDCNIRGYVSPEEVFDIRRALRALKA